MKPYAANKIRRSAIESGSEFFVQTGAVYAKALTQLLSLV